MVAAKSSPCIVLIDILRLRKYRGNHSHQLRIFHLVEHFVKGNQNLTCYAMRFIQRLNQRVGELIGINRYFTLLIYWLLVVSLCIQFYLTGKSRKRGEKTASCLCMIASFQQSLMSPRRHWLRWLGELGVGSSSGMVSLLTSNRLAPSSLLMASRNLTDAITRFIILLPYSTLPYFPMGCKTNLSWLCFWATIF